MFLFLVHRDSVSHLAQLDLSVADITVRQTHLHGRQTPHVADFPLFSQKKCPFFPQETMVAVLHVTSCQDEFRQQQIAVLWRASGATHTQVTPIIRSHSHTHRAVQLVVFQSLFFNLLFAAAEASCVWSSEDPRFSPQRRTIPAVRCLTVFI